MDESGDRRLERLRSGDGRGEQRVNDYRCRRVRPDFGLQGCGQRHAEERLVQVLALLVGGTTGSEIELGFLRNRPPDATRCFDLFLENPWRQNSDLVTARDQQAREPEGGVDASSSLPGDDQERCQSVHAKARGDSEIAAAAPGGDQIASGADVSPDPHVPRE